MEREEILSAVGKLLSLPPYFNVATSLNDEPWNSPVWAARDSVGDFYWSSWKEAVHSRNLEANPRAFLTLFDSTRQRGTNNLRCLYLQCTVTVVHDPAEAAGAFELLYPGEAVNTSDFLAAGQKRFYRASPVKAWLNCLSERELTPATVKMRTEVPLETLRQST
jgi:hypothetical protein